MVYRKILRRKKELLALLLYLVIAAILRAMVPSLDKVSIQKRANQLNHPPTHYNVFMDRTTPDAAMKISTQTTTKLVQTSNMKQKTAHSITTGKPAKIAINSNTVSGSSIPYTASTSKPEFLMDRDRKCEPRFNPDDIKTPFKFYIYNLPSYFNDDRKKIIMTLAHLKKCYNLDYCGMGEELIRYSNTRVFTQGRQSDNKSKQGLSDMYDISIRNTHQFSLEVIIHYKLLHSPYRTLDPRRADIFYIPAYTALNCNFDHYTAKSFTDKLFEYLKNNETEYYRSGKPHFSTLGKIQREQANRICPVLRDPDTKNITYITIERESNPNWSRRIKDHTMIVAPYPSYIHLTKTDQVTSLHEYKGKQTISNLNDTNFVLDVPAISERNVFLFFAASNRRANPFRALLIDQFSIKTKDSYQEFFSKNEALIDQKANQVLLVTSPCKAKHRNTTIPWMLRSIFCLQPAGDSPTRKSFYDSILSGCIPVLFTERFPTTYPFQKWLQYDQFTITLDEKLVSQQGKNVSTLLQAVPVDTIKRLHNNVRRVAKWFQYSIPNGKAQTDDDAVTLLLKEVQYLYNLNGSQ